MMLYPSSPEAATRFLTFVNASPTPFHAVRNAVVRLEGAGFRKVGGMTPHGRVCETENTLDQRAG